MTIIGIIILLVVVGAVLAMVPMDVRFRNAIAIIVLLVVALWLLSAFGVLRGGPVLR